VGAHRLATGELGSSFGDGWPRGIGEVPGDEGHRFRRDLGRKVMHDSPVQGYVYSY
jgi:hypothetical protein